MGILEYVAGIVHNVDTTLNIYVCISIIINVTKMRLCKMLDSSTVFCGNRGRTSDKTHGKDGRRKGGRRDSGSTQGSQHFIQVRVSNVGNHQLSILCFDNVTNKRQFPFLFRWYWVIFKEGGIIW